MAATSIIGCRPPQNTDFADARFVIILEMCDRATEAVSFLPLELGIALIEQLPGRH
jgi:hypothetical protein